MKKTTFLQHYLDTLGQQGHVPDSAQDACAKRLQRNEDEWIAFKEKRSNKFKKFFSKAEVPTGVYLWGGVGRGKSVLMDTFYSHLPLNRKIRIHFHEFDVDTVGQVLETDKFSVFAEKLDHTIPCVGYRVIQKDLEGTLDADALSAAGVPFGPLFGKIKNGQNVTLEDGTEIIASDYISPPRPGKVVTILGDTRKCHASVRLAINADVLVHESTYGKGDEQIARKHGHSTNMEAAQVAKDAGVKRLLLNHISPRFLSKDISQLRNDARTIFEQVHIVKDLEEIEL